ncbi:MAG: 3-dehydroquinate synthase [Actinomycetota bacterium]|jgi:5-deoxy-5-amino-3-dehydroquinate synthase
MTVHRVLVDLGDRSYPVLVGHGAVCELASLVPSDVERVVVVTDPDIPFAVAVDRPTYTVHVTGGEDAKSLATVERVTSAFARHGITRRDLVIGVGGGLVTDLAGFAAAVWHRGTRVLHVSTTLLGMVDAAIGGKTAVNLPEGKNLVGAFWQPIGVIADLDALATLPERETKCGLGEVAKYHFLSGDDLLALPLDQRIARCAAIKAEIVASDENESGRRMLLNYGHTLAHAIETCGAHRLAHGEAVAVGLLFAARLSRELGRIGDDRVARHDHVVRTEYGLADPAVMVGLRNLDVDDLMTVMARDKKATRGLTFVLDGPTGPEVVHDVDSAVVRRTLVDFLN